MIKWPNPEEIDKFVKEMEKEAKEILIECSSEECTKAELEGAIKVVEISVELLQQIWTTCKKQLKHLT
jgi:hypothetical protein